MSLGVSELLKNDFERLNDQQKEIIKKFHKNSLVVAGPGTGKTRTISVLIAKQLEKGVRLKEILALTFSDKAATELRQRVLEYFPQSFDQCWISTFHSFCARILREQYYEVGVAPDFKLLNAFKESLLMSFICRRLDPSAFPEYGKVLAKRGFQQEASTLIGILKSNLVTPEEFEDAIKNAPDLNKKTRNRCFELLNIYQQYEKERIKDNYLDYRDLIALSIKVLKNPRIADIYRKRFKVILVDEFQDTDPAQFLLLTLLKGESTDIKTAVIGDPRQSIYRFRGADPSMMTPKGQFKQKYKASIFPLSQNYRSAKSIVKSATMLNWAEKLSTDGLLNPNSQDEGFIKYYKVKNEIEEARVVGRQIANYLIYGNNGKKYKPSDVAILVRNNYQIDLLAESLQTLHIPYQIAEDMKFFKAEEIITLVSLLKIAGAVDEEMKESALQTAFLSPAFGLNPLWTQAIISEIANNNGKISSILKLIEEKEFSELPETDEANQNKAIEFVKVVRLLESKSSDEISSIVSAAITSVLPLLENASETTSRNILHLRNMLSDYSEVFQRNFGRRPFIADLLPELEEWINYYALNIESSEIVDENAVKIMTVHQSKGLEFPLTIISGLCEGQFPVNLRENILLGTAAIEKIKNYLNSRNREINFFNPYPNSDEEQLEEERRLFFVAITRAKEGLIMTVPMRLGTDPATPAPFFYEMGIKPNELEKDDKILTLSEFRTAVTSLSQDELLELEPTLQEVEKQIPPEYAIHGIRPRIFNKAKHDKVELPDDFSFSATSLKNYMDCPRKFYFKNLLGITNPLENNKDYFIVGNAYHKILEELHKPGSPWELAKEPTDEDLMELFEKFAAPMLEVIPFFERHKQANLIKKALPIYRDAVFKNEQFPCRHTKGVEKLFSFELAGSKIKGRFDRIALIDNDSIQIIDYKTSKSGIPNSEKIYEKSFPKTGLIEDQLEMQLPIYLLACKSRNYKNISASTLYVMTEAYKKLYKGMKAGYQKSAALNFGCGPCYGAEVSDDDLKSFELRLTELINKIKTDKAFECIPSDNENAKSCLTKDGCEFSAFCQVGLELLKKKQEKESEVSEQ